MTRDVLSFNRRAWNRQVEDGNRWTLPVTPEALGHIDMNADGVIDAGDYPLWRDNLTPAPGQGSLLARLSATGDLRAVPEPATWLLIFTAGLWSVCHPTRLQKRPSKTRASLRLEQIVAHLPLVSLAKLKELGAG